MLILTRKLNDSFLLELDGGAELVEVKVVEVVGGQVRLGITAPEDCKIWRKEIYQTVQYNRQAASASGQDLRGLLPKGTGEASRATDDKQ